MHGVMPAYEFRRGFCTLVLSFERGGGGGGVPQVILPTMQPKPRRNKCFFLIRSDRGMAHYEKQGKQEAAYPTSLYLCRTVTGMRNEI